MIWSSENLLFLIALLLGEESKSERGHSRGQGHRLSELLAREIPNAESSAFFKTGSDATDVAVRLARAVTGRRAVAHWGLHGWHDWSSGGKSGVLEESSRFTHLLHFNDLERSLKVLRSIRDDLACVIVMPYEVEMPGSEFLHELRRAAHSYGALFVLDEIRSGFRIHRKGAQGAFNIDADLVALGKGMGNGYPISALCGQRHLMDEIIKLGITVTFFRSPAAMAASITTVSRLIEIDGPGRLAALGARLMKNISEGCSELREVFGMRGHPATPEPEFMGPLQASASRCREMLCWRLFRRGILTPAAHHWFLCASMSETDIDFASETIIESVRGVVADSLDPQL